jgi:hypothetical protein
MNALTEVSILFAVLAGFALLVAIAYVISKVASRFFGDDPGGRDPNLPGQFMIWGNGPNYIDLLRAKRGEMAQKRKERKRKSRTRGV